MHADRPRQQNLSGALGKLLGIAAIIAAITLAVVLLSKNQSFVAPGGPGPAAPDTYTLLFAGDIMLDRNVKKQITQQQDPLYPFLFIAPTIQAADLAFANVEGPISSRGSKVGSIYSFRFEPVGTINALQFAGFDVVSLANNHIWDYGRTAAADTLEHLRQAGISFVGFGKDFEEANTPVIKTVGDTTVAFLGYTEFYSEALWADSTSLGLSEYNPEKIIERIKALNASGQADIIVISLHWGEEYETRSRPAQQELAHNLIDAGADLVIGHHPHVAQEIEEYNGGWIAYSLGNFIFDQNFSEETMSGLLAEATIANGKVTGLRPVPITLSPTFQPRLSE